MYNVIFSGTMLTDADLSGTAFSSLERNAPHFAGARLPKALDALGEEMRAMLIAHDAWIRPAGRSEEHTSEVQPPMRISYTGFCLNKKMNDNNKQQTQTKDYIETTNR